MHCDLHYQLSGICSLVKALELHLPIAMETTQVPVSAAAKTTIGPYWQNLNSLFRMLWNWLKKSNNILDLYIYIIQKRL